MAKLNKQVFFEVLLTADEIEAILRQWLSTQRAGAVVVPPRVTFELSEHGARFTWNEGNNG